jgi:hypothetical protein
MDVFERCERDDRSACGFEEHDGGWGMGDCEFVRRDGIMGVEEGEMGEMGEMGKVYGVLVACQCVTVYA